MQIDKIFGFYKRKCGFPCGISCPVEQSGEKWNEMGNRGDDEILLGQPWVATHTCRGASERGR